MDLFSSVGTQELLMILLVAVIVIGPAKIAEFGKTMGRFTRNVKQASAEFSTNLTKEMELEKQEKASPAPGPAGKH